MCVVVVDGACHERLYVVRSAGLAKLPRLLRMGRLTKKLDVFVEARALRVVILLLGFALLAHILACFWYFIGIELIRVRQLAMSSVARSTSHFPLLPPFLPLALVCS